MLGIGRDEQARRASAFEQVTELTAAALSNPEAAKRLGVLGVDLVQINEDAFLPNIRRGSVTLPHEYEDSDGIAIVPVVEKDLRRGFHISPGMLSPTPQKRKKMEEQAQEPGSSANVDEFVTSQLLKISGNISPICPRLSTDSPTGLFTTRSDSRSQGERYFSSRPILFIYSDGLETREPEGIPADVVHEYVHASDIEATDTPPKDEKEVLHRSAYTELRAYFVTYTLLKVADLVDEGDVSAQLEKLRRRFGLGLPPLDPTRHIPPRLISAMYKNGLLGQRVQI